MVHCPNDSVCLSMQRSMTQDGDASKNHALGPPSAGISHMEPFGETSIGSLIECTVTPRYGIRRLTEGTVISNMNIFWVSTSMLYSGWAPTCDEHNQSSRIKRYITMTDGGNIIVIHIISPTAYAPYAPPQKNDPSAPTTKNIFRTLTR